MEDLGRKFRTIDWKGLQRQAKKVQASTASALKDLVMTDLENKVRAATGDTNWGAPGADLAQIAAGTYNREDFTLIMSIVWQRLASTRWRCVYKALDVLKYLVLHGASRVLDDARDALPHIRRLEHFAHIDPVTRRDEGANVRARAAAFVTMLGDDALLEEERNKSDALRAKIGNAAPPGLHSSPGGLSSEDYRFGAGRTRNDSEAGDGTSFKPGRRRHTAHGAYGAPGFSGYDDELTGGLTAAAERADARVETKPPTFNAGVDDLLGGALEPASTAPAQVAAPAPAPAPKPSLGLGELGELGALTAPAAPAARAAAPAAAPPPAFSLGGDDDDDDDFDPRAGRSGSGAGGAATGGGAVPTSRLIANLAAGRGSAAAEAARTESAATPLSAMQRAAAEQAAAAQAKPAEDVAYGGLVHFENLMLDKSTRVESRTVGQASAPGAPAVTPKPVAVPVPQPQVEADPFGDLLSTAKKTGVL